MKRPTTLAFVSILLSLPAASAAAPAPEEQAGKRFVFECHAGKKKWKMTYDVLSFDGEIFWELKTTFDTKPPSIAVIKRPVYRRISSAVASMERPGLYMAQDDISGNLKELLKPEIGKTYKGAVKFRMTRRLGDSSANEERIYEVSVKVNRKKRVNSPLGVLEVFEVDETRTRNGKTVARFSQDFSAKYFIHFRYDLSVPGAPSEICTLEKIAKI